MIDEALLESLLQRSEDETLDFKSVNYDLSVNVKKVDLLKDVISMANTPRDEPARIVLGVKRQPNGETELLGLDRDFDEADFQSQFPDRVSPIPRVSYDIVESQGMRFGVISIPPDKDGPYFSLKDFERRLVRNILYFRRGSKNDEATAVDYARILAWFEGRAGRRSDQMLVAPSSDAWEALIIGVNDFPLDAKYVLITNRRENSMEPAVDALGFIPWSAVFDFDPESESNGLISAVEPTMKEHRPIHRIVHGNRPSLNLARATHWFFARGIKGRQDTLVDGAYRKWLQQYKRELDEQTSLVASLLAPAVTYCIALWDGGLSEEYLNTVLESALGAFADRLNIVLITPDASSTRSTAGRLEIDPIEIPLNQFYQGGRAKWISRGSEAERELVIPSSSGAPIPIAPDDQLWLQEELEIIGLNEGRFRPDAVDDGFPFLRGSEITWYELAFHLDVDRDKGNRIQK